MQVADILKLCTKPLVTVSPEDSVLEAIQLLARHDYGALMVVDKGDIVGIFSERDYTRKVALLSRKSSDTKVKEIMSTQVCTVPPHFSAEDCLSLMNESQIRHLPVMENGSLLGFISILDVANALVKEKGKTIDQLKTYVSETWPF